jgi:hypothetical protein
MTSSPCRFWTAKQSNEEGHCAILFEKNPNDRQALLYDAAAHIGAQMQNVTCAWRPSSRADNYSRALRAGSVQTACGTGRSRPGLLRVRSHSYPLSFELRLAIAKLAFLPPNQID